MYGFSVERSARLVGGVLLAAHSLLLSGCLLQPSNGLVVADRDASIAISGRSGIGNTTVTLLAAPESSGAFTPFATLPTRGNSSFSGSGVIPNELWTLNCAEGNYETFVIAQNSGGGDLLTFDNASIAGRSPAQCIVDESAEVGFIEGVLNCVSEDSPVVRIATEGAGTLPAEVDGDILIDDPSDVNALACVEEIIGSLTIDDMSEDLISLPLLREVTGNVTIVYERGMGDSVDAETVDLPALRVVGGNLDLLAPRPPVGGDIVTVNFGLPALVSIGGNLTIDIDAFNFFPSGLTGLPNLTGSLTYNGGSSDSSAGGLLTSLTSIGGDLTVNLPPPSPGGSTTQSYFNALTSVLGDVSVTGGHWVGTTMFNSLGIVGGDMRLNNIWVFPGGSMGMQTSFDSLINVGGILDVDDLQDSVTLIGGAAVSIGGLRLNDNNWLTDLATSLTKYTLSPTGPITITNNANLPQCDAEAYVAGLPGYSGVAIVSGNQACLP